MIALVFMGDRIDQTRSEEVIIRLCWEEIRTSTVRIDGQKEVQMHLRVDIAQGVSSRPCRKTAAKMMQTCWF